MVAFLLRRIAATDREIDPLVCALYDLTAAEIRIVEGAAFPLPWREFVNGYQEFNRIGWRCVVQGHRL